MALWQKGQSGNPAGKRHSVFASFGEVSEHLLQKYTAEQILDLASDKKRMSKELSSWHAIVLVQLANALSARDNGDMALERERLLDRTIGKAVSRTEISGKDGEALKINVVTGVEAHIIEGEFRELKEIESKASALVADIDMSSVLTGIDAVCSRSEH